MFSAAIISLLLDAPFEFFIRSNLIFEWEDFKEEWHLNWRRTKITHGRKLCHICQKLITDVKNLGGGGGGRRGKKRRGEKIKRGGEKKQLIFGSSDHDSLPHVKPIHWHLSLLALALMFGSACLYINQMWWHSASTRTLHSIQQGQMEVLWYPHGACRSPRRSISVSQVCFCNPLSSAEAALQEFPMRELGCRLSLRAAVPSCAALGGGSASSAASVYSRVN